MVRTKIETYAVHKDLIAKAIEQYENYDNRRSEDEAHDLWCTFWDTCKMVCDNQCLDIALLISATPKHRRTVDNIYWAICILGYNQREVYE